jgi:myo-inositol 2-dehydrogenase / D-chiro-inositol 1-dehydrogenase
MQQPESIRRRKFLGDMAASATAAALLGGGAALAAEKPASAPPKRKVKLGVVGLGGRGTWITGLFQKHGGYEIHALADYFPSVVQNAGKAMGVPPSRCFSSLSGYKKVIASGAEALLIIDVPYFYPEQARAAIDAGLHVYMAKPVAVDAPGCLAIGAAGLLATQKKLCFLVDYQLPLDPAVIEVAQRVRKGAAGKLAHIVSIGFGWQGWPDPPLGATIESRLRDEIWLSDTALSGDTIVSYDIHIIDSVLELLGKRPTSACGISRTCRADPHGDRTDCAGVVYQFDDGLLWTHSTQSITNNFDLTTLSASLFGMQATAHIQYGGKVYVRGGPDHYSGTCGSVYDEGAIRNVAAFHKNIVEGNCQNPTVQRAVDGTLTAILGREAAARRCFLTIEDLVKENKRLDVNLKGLEG